ncbi:MAG: hypothetical protein ONB48_15210 [candidate division KSB1 bacterium]|nr:hypothetical protein [candidate division KSB1 bacterium]MDZ7273414.1 hypothetical protein [candidate division KSB1 bacterium]MDZ7286993.1 hypothetical protein [candidate division KSB1 bacterium]MDZ7299654.1 hypothetical protein [candidate division KSB1 bacterium]MDZ7350769.1 hypothetical protein [candidate division KSB1 bacterium]
MNDAPAFGGIQLVSLAGERQRFPALQPDRFGADLLDRCDFTLRKKLLRFGTGLSTRPPIKPVNF